MIAPQDTHPTAFVMRLERADGGRQDLDFDAAVPMYINRRFMVEWLAQRVYASNHQNILQDFIFVTHTQMEYVAMMRANAAVDLLVARPFRWFAGKSSELVDWSPYSMGEIFDDIEGLFLRTEKDGNVLLSQTLLGFWQKYTERQPAFAAYLKNMMGEDYVTSPDGTVKHLQFKLAWDEIFNPQDPTNVQTQAATVENLALQARAAILKMHDTRTVLPEYLTSQDGVKSIGKMAQGHTDTVGCEAANDKLAESVFGAFDRVLRQFGGISREAAAAVAQASRSKSFLMGDNVQRRKPAEAPKPGMGYFFSLPAPEQEALVEYTRTTVRASRKQAAADNEEVAAYIRGKLKSSSEQELESLITRYGIALSFFERWESRGVRTMAELKRGLKRCKDTQAQLDCLREQIEMRTLGLQWVEFATHWSSGSNETVGTVPELTEHLKTILAAEHERRAAGELPSMAPAPQAKRKTFKELGELTEQAKAFAEQHQELPAAELRARAEKERERLEAIGELDSVSDGLTARVDRWPHGRVVWLAWPLNVACCHSCPYILLLPFTYNRQPKKAPTFDTLVGKLLDIRWRYWTTEGSKRKGVNMWCVGEVIEAADGKTTKRSAKCKSTLPWGAVRIKYS